MIEALIKGAISAKGITTFSQHSVQNAVLGAHDICQEQLELHQAGLDNSVLSREFLLVGSGVTTATAAALTLAGLTVATAGTATLVWSSGLVLAGTSFTFGLAALPDDAKRGKIEAQTAEELFNDLFERIREVVDYVGRSEEELHREMREVEQEMEERRKDLTPVRPDLADMADPDQAGEFSGADFYHTDSDTYPLPHRQ